MRFVIRKRGASHFWVLEHRGCALVDGPFGGEIAALHAVGDFVEQVVAARVVGCATYAAPAEALIWPERAPWPVNLTMREMVREHVAQVVKACGGNKTEAARMLRVSRETISDRLTDGKARKSRRRELAVVG